MARNRTRAQKRKHKDIVVIASSDNSQDNLRSALGLQLIRLWMYDVRDGYWTKAKAAEKRTACEPLAYRWGDYTALY